MTVHAVKNTDSNYKRQGFVGKLYHDMKKSREEVDALLKQKIRERAYYIWEHKMHVSNCDWDIWFQAEKEIKAGSLSV